MITLEQFFEDTNKRLQRFISTLTDCKDCHSYYVINNKRHFVLNDSKINGKFNTFSLKIKFKGKYVYLNELDDEEFGKYLNSLTEEEYEKLWSYVYFKCFCVENKLCTTFYLNGILVNEKYIERWFDYEKIETSLDSYFDNKNNEIINDNSLSAHQKECELKILDYHRRAYKGQLSHDELEEWSQEGHNNITVLRIICVLNFFKEFRNEINSLFKKQTKFKTMKTFLSKRNVWELIQSRFYYFSYLEDKNKPTDSFINREFLLFKDLILRILDKGIGNFTEKELNKKRTYELNKKYNSIYERFYGYFSNLLNYFKEKFDILKFKNYFLNYFKLDCRIFSSLKMLRLYKVTKKLELKKIKEKYEEDFKKSQEYWEKQGWHLCRNGKLIDLDFYKSDRLRRFNKSHENKRISQAIEFRKRKELNTLAKMALSM